jgi:hypothetical protein
VTVLLRDGAVDDTSPNDVAEIYEVWQENNQIHVGLVDDRSGSAGLLASRPITEDSDDLIALVVRSDKHILPFLQKGGKPGQEGN